MRRPSWSHADRPPPAINAAHRRKVGPSIVNSDRSRNVGSADHRAATKSFAGASLLGDGTVSRETSVLVPRRSTSSGYQCGSPWEEGRSIHRERRSISKLRLSRSSGHRHWHRPAAESFAGAATAIASLLGDGTVSRETSGHACLALQWILRSRWNPDESKDCISGMYSEPDPSVHRSSGYRRCQRSARKRFRRCSRHPLPHQGPRSPCRLQAGLRRAGVSAPSLDPYPTTQREPPTICERIDELRTRDRSRRLIASCSTRGTRA